MPVQSLESVLVANRRPAIQPATSPEHLEDALTTDFADVLADVGKKLPHSMDGGSDAGKAVTDGPTGPSRQVASPRKLSLQAGAGKKDRRIDSRRPSHEAFVVQKRSARLGAAAATPFLPDASAVSPPAPAANSTPAVKTVEVSRPQATPSGTAQAVSPLIQDAAETTSALAASAVAGGLASSDLAVAMAPSDHAALDAAQVAASADSSPTASPPTRAEGTHGGRGQSDARRAASGPLEDPEASAADSRSVKSTAVVRDEHGALSIHLSLPHIGALELKITGNETGSTCLSISAEREGTLRALIGDQAQLHAILKEEGVQPEGRTIEFNLLPASSDTSDSRSGSGPRDDSRPNHGGNTDTEGECGLLGSASGPTGIRCQNARTDIRSLNLIDITA